MLIVDTQIEVNTFEDAIKALEENIGGSVADAIIFLKDEAEDLQPNQVQTVLSAANTYLETGKPNDRITGSVLELLQDVISQVDPSALNLREVIRNVIV